MRDCFVALFDILGFTELQKSVGTEGLCRKFENLIVPAAQVSASQSVVRFKTPSGPRVGADPSIARLEYRIFSDTVLLAAPDASAQSFVDIVIGAQIMLVFGWSGAGMPLRGAIGFGDLVLRNHTILGSAVVDAYDGESAQVWSGCSLTRACEEHAANHGYTSSVGEVLVKYDKVPILDRVEKSIREESRLVIDWTPRVYKGASITGFTPTEDEHAQKIQKNTAEFESWARERREVASI